LPGQCAAANRAGNRCGKRTDPGRAVCNLHSGKSLQGIGHPAYRPGERVASTGRHSLSDAQQRQYETFPQERDDLLKGYDEIASLVVHVQELLDQHADTIDDADSWKEIGQTIGRIRRLRSVELRRIALGQEAMNVDRAQRFMQRMMQIAIDVCHTAPERDPEVKMRNHLAAEMGKLAQLPNVG
jgi:hypothetical protein